jgi:hypothetical protein
MKKLAMVIWLTGLLAAVASAYAASCVEEAKFCEGNDICLGNEWFALGYALYFGKGGYNPNHKAAIKCFENSAIKGNWKAQFSLGEIYSLGKDVIQDYSEAASLYEKAAIQGSKEAQLALGNLHLNGLIGDSLDIVSGCAWVYISKNHEKSMLCDKQLNQSQMLRTLHMVDELKKSYPRIELTDKLKKEYPTTVTLTPKAGEF